MGAASTLPLLLDAVVALCQAITTVPDLVVADGLDPEVDLGTLGLIIGADAVADEDTLTITGPSATLTWASLPTGQGARDESGQIPCVALAWGGDDSLSGQRRRAMSVVDAVRDALRGATQSPWLGVSGALFGGVLATSLRQGYTPDGPEVSIPFLITYRARV